VSRVECDYGVGFDTTVTERKLLGYNDTKFAELTSLSGMQTSLNCTQCHTETMAVTNHKQTTALTPSKCGDCHVVSPHGNKPTAATCLTQCHNDPAKAPAIDSATLSSYLVGMHVAKPSVPVQANYSWLNSATTSYVVNFDASSTTCPSTYTCTYTWAFGDAATGTGVATSHVYSGATPTFAATLTVSVDGTTSSNSITKVITPKFVNHAPVALGLRTAYSGTSFTSPTIVSNSTNAVPFTDASTDADNNITTVTVNWGDGLVSSAPATGATFSRISGPTRRPLGRGLRGTLRP